MSLLPSRSVLKCLVLAFVSLGAGPALSAGSYDPSAFVGIWYGVGEPDDKEIFYIDNFHADGTFNSEYRKCEKGKLIYQQTQSGKWSVANGLLTMNSTVINGKAGHFDHYYLIESVSPTEVKARLLEPDYLFIEMRIPAFEFPPCYLGS